MIDEKVKPKVKETIDKNTPPWKTEDGKTAEYKYFEKQATYNGEYRCGKRHGKGTLKWETGQTYEGEWKRDRQHGNGTLTTSNFTYVGDFRQNKFHGEGTMTSKQYTWSGNWWRGRKHG